MEVRQTTIAFVTLLRADELCMAQRDP